jgi:hypothetical protein
MPIERKYVIAGVIALVVVAVVVAVILYNKNKSSNVSPAATAQTPDNVNLNTAQKHVEAAVVASDVAKTHSAAVVAVANMPASVVTKDIVAKQADAASNAAKAASDAAETAQAHAVVVLNTPTKTQSDAIVKTAAQNTVTTAQTAAQTAKAAADVAQNIAKIVSTKPGPVTLTVTWNAVPEAEVTEQTVAQWDNCVLSSNVSGVSVKGTALTISPTYTQMVINSSECNSGTADTIDVAIGKTVIIRNISNWATVTGDTPAAIDLATVGNTVTPVYLTPSGAIYGPYYANGAYVKLTVTLQ